MMDFHCKDEGKGRYVCPSDRQLALRAKLHTGWSTGRPSGSLEPSEKNKIISVIQRNEQLELAERQRVGRLVERLEKIKLRAAECGPRYCRLCGQTFGLLGATKLICEDCRKPVCSKCSIELHAKGPNVREIWLCKICSETREMWKKTGAWFYKGLPRYELPQRSNSCSRVSVRGEVRQRPEKHVRICTGIKVIDSSSEDDETDSKLSSIDNGLQRIGSLRLGTNGAYKGFSYDDNISLTNRRQPPNFFRRLSSTNDFQVTATTPIEKQNKNQDWETISITGTPTTDVPPPLLQPTLRKTNNGTVPNLLRRASAASSWSMSETASINSLSAIALGQNQTYREPPLGWLELSLVYNEGDHTLDCTIIRARDLPAMDNNGLADPFCKLNIVTEFGTARQKKWVSTKTVHKTRNPEINESVRFLGVEPEELGNSTLYIVLLDDDKYGHDFLGCAKVHLGPVYVSSQHMSIPLGLEDQHCLDAINAGPWIFGQIHISLCYNTKKRALIVLIKECVNLMAKDGNGFSDPFIKLQLKPDVHRKKTQKTTIKWKNLNPVYNEQFSFEIRPNDLDKQSLIITVWDKDLAKSNDFLGSLILGPTSKGKRLNQWKDCIRLPDHFHEQKHFLAGDHHPH